MKPQQKEMKKISWSASPDFTKKKNDKIKFIYFFKNSQHTKN